MRTRRLGHSDLNLTTLGIGAWAMGGPGYAFEWGPQDDNDSIRAIHRALDLGINWIDTAPVYGLGHSEEVVARALEGRRDKVILATKCGMVWDNERNISHQLTKASIERECEASLKRLKTDVIDLYQIHWPEPPDEIEEGWEAVNDLVAAGKIRCGAVSNFSVEQMARCSQIAPITSLQPPYSLLNRKVEKEILPYCGAQGIGVVAYSPIGNGLLTGKYTKERVAALPASDWRGRLSHNFRSPRLERVLALVEELQSFAAASGHTVTQLALAWVLRRPEVTSAIIGLRNVRQAEECVSAGDWEVPDAIIQSIHDAAERHLDPDA